MKGKKAYFGGSFDPPHTGHLELAKAALRSGLCGEVVFAPAWVPPHKQGRRRAPFADRLAMLKLLIGDTPGLSVTGVEGMLRLVPSYTIDVLEQVTRLWGERPLLLIGGDSLRDLHSWHRAAELVREYGILTYPRAGITPTREELQQHWEPETTQKLLSGIIPGRFFEISSTELRFSMEKNAMWSDIKEEDKEYLPKPLRDYIRSRGLYQGENTDMEPVNTAVPATPVSVSAEELAKFCVHCAEEKLAENIQLLPVRGVSSITDFFVIGTASSEPHLRALASFVERQVREKYRKRVLTRPDESAGGWVLLDFGDVIVHLMTPEMRERYDLEGLWGENIAAQH